MRHCLTIGFIVLALFTTQSSLAVDVQSGLQVGDRVPAFLVTKSGGIDDGVDVDETLCYRCRLGNKPVVMVFARSTGDNLANLVRQIDKTVAKNADKKMASFVNILGKNADAVAASAKQFVKENKFKNVAICVPTEQPNGPDGFKISPDADVTVMTYVNGQVKDNKVFGKGGADRKGVEAVLTGTKKILPASGTK